MIEKWRTCGADIVQAVKVKRGRESATSKAGAFLFYVILNKLSGFELKGASDFKLIDRKVWIRGWRCANAMCFSAE